MRLIDTKTLQLEEFYGQEIPGKYAILSHTWETEEVSFREWQRFEVACEKRGFSKIKAACDQAAKHGMNYLWIDTNCIDKSSSAELSEAINSMFDWYSRATVCYAYLMDVLPETEPQLTPETRHNICQSKWFTRGWTLQELLAPPQLVFYANDWSKLGTRSSLAHDISAVTRIDTDFLLNKKPLSLASVAQKMSWVSRRVTTRVEDMAYCMLGIFDINMPLLYGEGSKAFVRLQEEIIKVSNDHTIFCWTWTDAVPSDWVSMLAPCPQVFAYAGDIVPTRYTVGNTRAFSMTNAGLSISLPLVQTWSYYLAILNVGHASQHFEQPLCIPIWGDLDNDSSNDNCLMQRVPFPPAPLFCDPSWKICEPALFIRSRQDMTYEPRAKFMTKFRNRFGFVLCFDSTEELLDEMDKSSRVFASFENTYLTEKTRDLIEITSHPRGFLKKGRGIVALEDPRTSSSGALVILGRGKACCVIFLGLGLHTSGRSRRFCQVLNPRAWGQSTSHRQELLDKLLREHTQRDVDAEWSTLNNCSAAIGNSTEDFVLGDLSLAYISVGQI
ncbi:heterokaryon incompatibility protein-domain-containing protein [Dactylonectria macrodidyma]|uniref:Heterokaryon incompatibility protein-domain-containing protein n=1 Tax=Dactylonectria macrodidyma TaxID=307937 RepID=A0A9P9E1B9_9HYPO|nr:heterokaryon incompatibility protein-domain-containing protein [Dactylonectria macrodidyma]